MIELRVAHRCLALAMLLGLSACGGSGGDDNPSPAQPTVTLAASPTSIDSGQSSTLTWSSTHATNCTASGGWTGTKAASGTEQVTPAATATYTLTCTGSGGSAAQSVTVTVDSIFLPVLTLTANPTTITGGSAATLTWSSTSVTSCTASDGWAGAKATSGTEQVTPAATTTYTLNCTGSGGSVSRSATVTVVNPPPTLTLTASDPLVAASGAAMLTWTSTNASTCTASGGWSGSKATSGTESTGALTAATTFTLECAGPGGSATGSTVVSVAAAGNTVVRGRIQFERPLFTAVAGQGLNFANPVISPARQAVVEAINNASSRTRIAATTTDANGSYWLEVPQNTQMVVSARAEMISSGSAPTWTFRVLNNTNNGALYVLDGAGFDSGTATVTRDLLATTGWGGTGYTGTRAAAPFAILDTVYRTRELILSAVPTTAFPALNLYWSPDNRTTVSSAANWFCTTNGNIGTTFYTNGALALDSGNCTPQVALPAGIYVLGDYAGGAGDTDEFDQHVIAHEFGHYIEDRFSRSDSIGGDHGAGDRLDLRVAFGEGWGNAYSGMTLNDPVYRDSRDGVSADFQFNMESDSADAEGWYSESSVHEILWDLFDSTNDGADSLSLGFAPLYSVMTGAQRTTEALTSIYTFAAGLRALSSSTQISGLNALLTGESISASADAFGSGETNTGGISTATPIYTDISRNQPLSICSSSDENDGKKLGARRFLRLTLASATALGISVQGAVGPGAPANGQPASDPDIYVYSRGELIEAGTSTGSSETLLRRVYPAGVNILEVHDYVGGVVPHCMTISISG